MRRIVTVVLVLGLALVGCRVVRGVLDTERALRRAGYRDVNVDVHTDGVDRVRVTYRRGGDAEQAAGVVWRTLALRFDEVVVGRGRGIVYDRDFLRERFGPRPASYDRRSISDELTRVGIGILAGLGAAALFVVAAVVVVIVFLVRRSRRRAPPSWGPAPETPPGWPRPG